MADTPDRPRSRSSSHVTLDDVARACGVSPITVSRALRGARNVAPELQARVQAAVDQLGYVPNVAARALASARSSHVAVLIPSLTNQLFVELLEAVQDALSPHGFQSLIGVTHYDPAQEEALLRSYLSQRPAGVLLTGFDRSAAAVQMLERSKAPCVYLMETSAEPGVHSVGFSQQDAGRAIVQHLLQRGRRRIAYAAGQLDPRVMLRLEGYREALRAAGCHDPALELLVPGPTSMALGGRQFEDLLARHPDVDAIFYCNDDLAQGGLLAALRTGVEVPKRVAIAGFNDLGGSDQMLPPLTTVRTPRQEIGERAANMLLALMREETVAERTLDLGFELVVRQSS
ncbi:MULTISPECIES: LacI family DNA-binding transcriptional regulator [unclassified Variovorax]|jgi:LacI family gluconate utilization system Gnt-I transcriptional repressor|uniref:LacI family DNA-binding transcriptional regulator n=1 Tax=unclassified Variovorax TaxID=663243 RepID=UPI000F7D7FC7|nr:MULTISPECIES: LacI family DNA-binding transcriptional regulator [unclassified Variovorax]RSZ42504.1 LacI family DNA-binding transcriptional regulator [Variovorax sp. 553]RSZ43478.1 LacI family DNA-binding transcriptional regulator [Variovorax sp. 679]